MISDVKIERLAHHVECVPTLASWFEREWPSYYGVCGKANAQVDLLSYCNVTKLPVGVVALRDGVPCGVAALRAEAPAELPHLSPWAGAGFVCPALRRSGIGSKLLVALEEVAKELGYARIYCLTGSSVSLLERNAWRFIGRVNHDDDLLSVYDKTIG